MQVYNIVYNNHNLQAIEFTGEDSVDLMDKVYGMPFMDSSETDISVELLYLYRKNGKYQTAAIGDFVMRTNRGKLFVCRWREYRAMYAACERAA